MIVAMLYFLTYCFDYEMQIKIENTYFVAYSYQFKTMNEQIYEMIDLSVINHIIKYLTTNKDFSARNLSQQIKVKALITVQT